MVDELDIDATLAALADPTRRRVVELLRDGPQRAGALAEALAMSPAATSRHLRTLDAHGLVRVTTDPDDARGRLYELDTTQLVGLTAWLDQVQAHWSERLAAFKAHAEGTPQ
jgi:DNA-binding transcriptional ArsR family regulator